MFFTYVLRELRRRHRSALLTALGLAVGVALVVAVTAYADGVGDAQDTVLHSLYGVGTDITVSQAAQMGQGGPQQFGMQPPDEEQQGRRFSRDRLTSMGQQSIAVAKVGKIAAFADVDAAVGSLRLDAMHVSGKFAEMIQQSQAGEAVGGAQGGASSSGASSGMPQAQPSMAPIQISSFSVSGVDVSDLTLGPLSSGEVTSGRSFSSDETKADVALVTKAYAKQNELAVGDTVKIGGVKFTIVGIVALPTGSTSSDVYIPLARAQKLSDNEDKVNQIYVRAATADDITAVKKEIKSVLPKATVTTSEDLAEQVSGSLSSASSLADRLGRWLAIAALAAAFAVASLLTVSAVSRRVREFGTLKALGWRGRRIVAQVLGEATVVGIVGGVLGAALGGAAAQSITVHLTAPVSASLVLAAVGLALAGGLLAGALGGWRASRLRPADALRRVD